jgi:hypothetical protein
MKVVYAALLAVWCVVPVHAEDYANMAEPNAMPETSAPQAAPDEWMNNPESGAPQAAIIPAGGVTIPGQGRVVENTIPDGNVQVEIRGAPARGGVRTIPVYRGPRNRQRINRALRSHGIDPVRVERLSQLRMAALKKQFAEKGTQGAVRQVRDTLANLIGKVNTNIYPRLKNSEEKNVEQDARLTKLETSNKQFEQKQAKRDNLIYQIVTGLGIAVILMALWLHSRRNYRP